MERHAGADEVRALARSAPWRWRELDVTVRRPDVGTVRALLIRGDHLAQVADEDGVVLQRSRRGEEGAGATTLAPASDLGPDPGRGSGSGVATFGWGTEMPASMSRVPVLRADGLVAARPHHVDDAPFWHDYFWVALFDPVELADGQDCEGREDISDEPGGEHPDGAGPTSDAEPEPLLDEAGWPRPRTDLPGTEITDVRAETHHGRPVRRATVRPTSHYEPRCGCCPLLPHPAQSRREFGEKEARRLGLLDGEERPVYEIALDVGTGVLVHLSGPHGTTDIEIHSAS